MIESFKEQMLELIQAASEIDTCNTPYYVFAEHFEAALEKELQGHTRGGLFHVPDFSPAVHSTAREILAKSTINLSGLGLEAAPHAEFLKDFADGTARLLAKMYVDLNTRFGHNVAISAITSMPLKFA